MNWKQKLVQKLTSRKLWAAIAGFVSGLVLAFKGSAELAETISGCIMAGASVIAYIVAEGLTDAAHKGETTEEPKADEEKPAE